MAFFYPSRFKTFFSKYNLNSLYQEITASLIGIFAGFYAYEKREEFFGLLGMENGKPFEWSWPTSWTTAKNKPVLDGFIFVLCAILFIKLLIYLRALDLNKVFRNEQKKKIKGFNLNGIIQEIATLVIGTTFGVFSSPVVKTTFFVFEKSEYPDYRPAVYIISISLLVKLLIYAKAINLNAIFYKKTVVNPGELPIFFREAEWNAPMKEFLSALIGVGIGLYLFQSNMIFWPEQKFGKAWGYFTKAANEGVNQGLGQSKEGRGILQFLGLASGQSNQKTVKLVPDSFSEPEKKPYWVWGTILVSVCVFLKFLMYIGKLDFNAVRNQLFNRAYSRGERVGRDYNGIVDEVVMLLLTIIVGLLADPFLENLKGAQVEYPYGGLSVLCFFALVVVKGGLFTTVLDFNRAGVPKSTARAKPVKKKKFRR